MKQHTRRDFLKTAAMLSGAAGVSGVVPESIRRALAIEPEPGSTHMDAEHIVILMQENRSFDHALGTLQGVRGFNDPRAIRQPNGNSVFVQSDAAGNSYAPWRLDIKDTRITWMGSVPHTRHSQVDAWNHGHHDGWIEAKRSDAAEYADLPLTMGHYTREDLPFYYALADAFTVCDQSYCSVMSSTTPNRSLFWTGTIRDRQSVDSKVYVRNEEIEAGGMTWKTFPERLQEAGIGWKFYQNELTSTGGLSDEEQAWLANFGCNIFEFFAAYHVKAYPGFVLYLRDNMASQQEEIDKLHVAIASAPEPVAAQRLRVKLAAAERDMGELKAALSNSGEARYRELTEKQRMLHDAAFVTNAGDPRYRALEAIGFESDGAARQMMVPKGDILHQFRKDVNEGNLPAVSWLTAPENFSDHPVAPWYGAWYVSEVMDILTKNPEVWKKTIFILTYDENDGYFDHAPSFVAADPKRPETGGASAGIDTGLEYTYAEDELRMGVAAKEARSGPIGMGYRVPTIVASPWSRGGWVNSQVFDHTSTLMFLEEFVQSKFGKTVKEENISAWRRAVSGNLTSCFRTHDAGKPKLDYLDRDKFVVGIQDARYKEVPANYKRLTAEEIEAINRNAAASAKPSQEPGVKPSCALPYELYADGGLSADGSSFELRMKAGDEIHGGRSAGAPFNVYLRNLSSPGPSEGLQGTPMQAATYAVRAGDTLVQRFPVELFAGSRYEIDVHGPNGFYRAFSGTTTAEPLQVATSYERRGPRLTGSVQVHLRNTGAQPLRVTLRDNAYSTQATNKSVAPGSEERVDLDLKHSHGWYDFTVQADGSPVRARFAGHADTGRESFSDPLMGMMGTMDA